MTTRKSAVTIFLFTTFLLAAPYAVWAGVEITEVMYNPAGSDTGREWVELHNAGGVAVELVGGTKGWRVSDGSNHVLANSFILLPGGFVVLTSNPATFAAQYGTAAPTVKSAISLNNTAGTISVLDAGGSVVDTVSYTKNLGAYDDGASLHKSGGTFVAGVPDPGLLGEIMPLKARPTLSPKKTQVAAVAEVAGAVAPQNTQESPSATATSATGMPPSTPRPQSSSGDVLWAWVLALGALVVLGVAAVWYARAPETSPAEDEFELE